METDANPIGRTEAGANGQQTASTFEYSSGELGRTLVGRQRAVAIEHV